MWVPVKGLLRDAIVLFRSVVYALSIHYLLFGDFKKRRDMFHYIRKQQFSVYFLQDTHFEKKIEKNIRSEWGYECFFSSFSSQSRGVAIMFNNNFDFKVNQVITGEDGNFLIVKITTINRKVTLINVYGPNRDNPAFLTKLNNIIMDNNFENIIWGGDWNLVLNPNLDYINYKHNNNPRAQERVLEIKDNLELTDVWREINQETLRFTWRRLHPYQQSRLDFFLLSDNLLPYVKESDILIGYRSDHSFISLKLNFTKEERNKTYWKFNSSLLKDKNCVKEINETIKKTTEQYSCLVYNLKNLEKIPYNEIQFTISDQLFLDVLLMEIRSTIISYSVKKKKETLETEKKLEQYCKLSSTLGMSQNPLCVL